MLCIMVEDHPHMTSQHEDSSTVTTCSIMAVHRRDRELFETSASAHDMFPNPLSTDNHVTIHCSMFTFIDTVVITYTRINCWCHQVTGDMAPFVRFLCRRPSLSGIVPVLSCKKKNTCKTLMCHCQGCS